MHENTGSGVTAHTQPASALTQPASLPSHSHAPYPHTATLPTLTQPRCVPSDNQRQFTVTFPNMMPRRKAEAEAETQEGDLGGRALLP